VEETDVRVPYRSLRRAAVATLLAAAGAGAGREALAFTVGILPSSRMLYLQIGTGTISFGGAFFGLRAANPASNANVNQVSVTVPAAAAAGGTALAMASSANTTTSPESGEQICPAATDVFIGGLYRLGLFANGTATLSVSTATPLTSGSNTIPFTEIAWQSVGVGDTNPTVPSGQFQGTANQQLATFQDGLWFEGCLRFSYRNTQPYPAGTFSGTAVYTLAAP
jgi:hypothetical protein